VKDASGSEERNKDIFLQSSWTCVSEM